MGRSSECVSTVGTHWNRLTFLRCLDNFRSTPHSLVRDLCALCKLLAIFRRALGRPSEQRRYGRGPCCRGAAASGWLQRRGRPQRCQPCATLMMAWQKVLISKDAL